MKVVSLNVFPVKSCQAVNPEEITIDEYGVVGDRRFMLIDGGSRFISQRRCPKLATITAKFIDESGTQLLHLSSPGMKDYKHLPIYSNVRVNAGLWEGTVGVVDQGDDVAKWFATLLGPGYEHVRLTCAAEKQDGYKNQVQERYLPEALKGKLPSISVGLTDGAPVSLASVESLADLNSRLQPVTGGCVGLNRFRMNIEISGCSKPFEEDDWLVVKIGSIPFLLYRDSERCKLTAVDQSTGEVDKFGPLEILRSYRAPLGPAHACFGQLLIPLQLGGVVRVGDEVTVLQTKKK
ncbi:mitochondrial amidoxime reducing component 2-like [Dysidea avara]|uniref:mitochondrial amidoxime reducing component 2-like n=1 Tax=Dysidea avara TaxID=196820 RepID=UPI00332D5155